MHPATAQSPTAPWLIENGPRELELLFRAIVYHPSSPILIADNDGNYREASAGAGKLLGVPREKIIGRQLDDFAQSSFKPQVSQLWRAFLDHGEQEGTLRLVGPDGTPREVEYTAKGNVLPVRHVLALRDKNAPAVSEHASADRIPPWVQDYALYLLDVEGCVAAWYAGAARIYGYEADQAMEQHVSMLYPGDDVLGRRAERRVQPGRARRPCGHGRLAGAEGRVPLLGQFHHHGAPGRSRRTAGLRAGGARLQRAARGATKSCASIARAPGQRPSDSTIAGVVSGEFDRIPEVNDAFLDLVGYSREDLVSGRLVWSDLTPPEYAALDELAHEEGLRFGACTPFEKELLRKDGTRVPVLVTTAVLKLSPFRWISFVQGLRERDRLESVEVDTGEVKHEFEEMVGGSAALQACFAAG